MALMFSGGGGSGAVVTGVLSDTTVGQGGLFLGQDTIANLGITNGSAQVVSAANIIEAWQFALTRTLQVGHMSLRNTVTFGAASHIGVAIYSAAGNRLVTTGAQDGTNIAGILTATIGSPVILNPGIYWMGICTDGVTSGRAYNLNIAEPSVAGLTQFINNTNGNRFVTGTSVSAGGVPPATLGTLSANANPLVPIALFCES